MLSIDLFDSQFERRLHEGAVDDLEARRIDILNDRMQDLLARAKEPAYRANPAALSALKKQFQQVKDERDSYYKVREAGIPGNIPVEKIPGKEDLLKGKGRSYYEDRPVSEISDQTVQNYKEKAWDEFAQGKDRRGAGIGRALDKQRGAFGHVKTTDQKKNSEPVNEYISMGSDKNYQEAEPYKNYRIYVRKKPFGNTGMYTAHTEIDRKEFMGKGSSQEEAVQAIQDRIDFVLNAQRKVTGSSTIDFNVKFATDLLADPRQTFYAKLENIDGEPKLVIAGAEVASDPELLAAGDFKRSALRNQVDDSGRATPLPGIPLTAKGLRSGDWIANGRYTVGKETQDPDGNRVFDLTYHSTAHTKSDKLRLNQPAFTLGTAREVDEHGGGIGPKQHWQDLMPEQSNLEQDDWYDDEEDQETDLRSGDYVRDTMDGESGEVFRMQGDPYERRVRILDRDGKGWYIEPSRLVRVDPQDPDVQRYFGKKRQRDMDEAIVASGPSQPLDDRAVRKLVWDTMKINADSGEQAIQRALAVLAKKPQSRMVQDLQDKFQNLADRLQQGVAEGWSDAIVARRTGQPRTPYAVYIKGRKWKDFENEDHAQSVANKLRAKFKADGRDPETITIAPTDMSEGWKSALGGAALAGAMAMGAGSAQAAGPNIANPTSIIQQIQAGKIQNANDLQSALGNASNKQAVFKILQAKAGLPGHGADSVINALGGKSSAGAQQPIKSVGQSGSIVQTPTDNFEGKLKEAALIEGIRDTAGATAVIACLLTGGSLTGCATAPQKTSAQQVLKTGQDVGRVAQTAKKITRAGTEEEVRQELKNFARATSGDPGAQNTSNILRLWKYFTIPRPKSPQQAEPPEYGPPPPTPRMPQYEAKEIVSKEDFVRERDRLLRMISAESNPANKQILKSAIRQLENRAENEGWITIQSRMIREENASNEAEQAILKRIMVAHTDLLRQYGPQKVMQAAEEVAYNVGDVDEIGTSDVSGWVNQVRQILGATA